MNFGELVRQLLKENTDAIHSYKLVVIHSNPRKNQYEYCDMTPMVGYNIQEALYHALVKYYGSMGTVGSNLISYIQSAVKLMNVNESGDFGVLDSTRNNQIEFIISNQNVHYDSVEEYIETAYIKKAFCEPYLSTDIIDLFDHVAHNKEIASKPDAIFDKDFLDGL